jgi:hypothetical protein
MLFCYHLIHVGLLQTKLQWMRFLYDFEVSWSIGFVFDPPLQVVMLGGFERYTHILDYDIIPSRSSWCKVAPFILVMHTLTLLYSTLLYPHDFRTPTKSLPKRQASSYLLLWLLLRRKKRKGEACLLCEGKEKGGGVGPVGGAPF